jgi:hypothetical protein
VDIPEEEQRNDLAAVNLLGYSYATAPDSAAKEAKLLEVLECFHGYLMKYLCMIVRGTRAQGGFFPPRRTTTFMRVFTSRDPWTAKNQASRFPSAEPI